MAHWVCERCGKGFQRRGSRPRRFCSPPCYHRTLSTAGGPGQFPKGLRPSNHVPVGSVKIRTRKRDGQKRAWVKVAEPNAWRMRATLVWEAAYGPLPKGLVIHHQDRDPLNDTVANLAALSRAAHLLEHRPEFEARRLARLKDRK